MKILVTGSGGLMGSALIPLLIKEGHSVLKLVRTKEKSGRDAIYWNPEKKEIDNSFLEGFDGIIHLAGESISEGKWTTEKKAKIRYSRVRGTEFLCKNLVKLSSPPKTFICASAIGYYGDRGEEVLNENSLPGKGFLPGICIDWEKSTKIASENNIRVVNLRFGIILTPKGGALAKMLPPFRMGAGGILGKGRQYMSWISIDDVLNSIIYILKEENIRGPVNLVSPCPVTNREFTKILAKILKRPAIFPVPSFALRTVFGEMADELLLSSTRVEPEKLIEAGYEFKHKTLENALVELLVK